MPYATQLLAHPRSSSRPLLIVLLGSLLTWTGLFAHGSRNASDLIEPEPDAARLMAVADQIAPTSVEHSRIVTRVSSVELFGEGLSYEGYQIVGADGAVEGSFTRVRAYPDATSVIDLAVTLEDGRLTRLVPIRPLTLGETPIEGFERLIARLARHRVEGWSRGLARVFRGLEHLEAAAAGPRPQPSIDPAAPPLITAGQPSLTPGQVVPDFVARSIAGHESHPASLKGSVTLLVFGDLNRGSSLTALDGSCTVVLERPDVVFLPVVRNTLAEALRASGSLALERHIEPRFVLDETRSLHQTFRVPHDPWVILLDRASKVAHAGPWMGQTALGEFIDDAVSPKDDAPEKTR